MHNLYKIISIVTLLMLSGCAGTELDKKLERFFYEEKNPGAAYQPGGSYEAKMISKYKR